MSGTCRLVGVRRVGGEGARERERAAAPESHLRGRSSVEIDRAERARWRRPARAPFPARVAVAIGCCAERKNTNRRRTRAPETAPRGVARATIAARSAAAVERDAVRASRRGGSRASRSSGSRSRVGEAYRARTHLASCSVASKRFAGATTANAGAGACSWRAARCLGATRAVRVSAMHMFGVELGVGVGHGGEARARGGGMTKRNVDALLKTSNERGEKTWAVGTRDVAEGCALTRKKSRISNRR